MLRLLLLLLSLPVLSFSQVVTTVPAFPKADEPVTIRVDVTGTSLDDFAWNNSTNPVWIWTWIDNGSQDADAPTNVNPATSPGQDAAKATRISTDPDVYEITFTPTVFFNRSASEIPRIGLKLKSRDWSDNKQTDNDRYITFVEGFELVINDPMSETVFVNQGEQFSLSASTSEVATITLFIDDELVLTEESATSLNYDVTVTEQPGTSVQFRVLATNDVEERERTVTYIVRNPSPLQVRPGGIIDGINYHDDETIVTLSVWAPGKSSVYVIGDFNGWSAHPDYLMKKDGEHFWLEISGLTPGQEYAYQYLVNESLRIADPYADKILDPDDQWIPSSIYPDLMSYPGDALTETWYFNRLSVLQTGQEAFDWAIESFDKPEKENLIVYELLIRDFFAPDDRSYRNLTDTISYLKRLGVNAVELMPIMEFNGNDSWGYNPTFMFAPDKAYGSKNDFKKFIDRCHEEGIAVILDIAMNHHDTPNPYVMMDFDFNDFKPLPTNRWFNVEAKHPFNVFFDMNHESEYTQEYLDTVNYYWLNEYKVDGYRFDLSKGFTQVNTGGDVSAWSAYDASRIALIKRMADKIWEHSPDAIIILEHFADNAEEKELAEYRADEGKGMLVWGNLNHAYNQNTLGFASGSDISWVYHGTRNWSVPHVVGYMESHDEERLMYRNVHHGNTSSTYSVRDISTALERVEAASVLFYTVPGPKMLWQFGEYGYDESINRCPDGTVNNDCRVAAKPVKWEYLQSDEHRDLFNHTADLLRLRNTYRVFTEGDVAFAGGSTLQKQLRIKNDPYTTTPSEAGEMNVQIVSNFNVTDQNIAVAFPHTGTWYDYYGNGRAIDVHTTPFVISFEPGEYRLYTDYPIVDPVITGIKEKRHPFKVYPNPSPGMLTLFAQGINVQSVKLRSVQGIQVPLVWNGVDQLDINSLSAGVYLLEVNANGRVYQIKVVKK